MKKKSLVSARETGKKAHISSAKPKTKPTITAPCATGKHIAPMAVKAAPMAGKVAPWKVQM
jgi:hypothetical protein